MADSIAQLLELANRHYHKKRLAEAEQVYRQALEIDQSNAIAASYLGGILNEIGRHQEAVEFLSRVPFHLFEKRSSAILRRRFAASLLDLKEYNESIKNYALMFSADAALIGEQAEQYVKDVQNFLPAPVAVSGTNNKGDHDKADFVFSHIYEKQLWGGGSGGGSDIERAAIYAGYVQYLINSRHPRTILDIGCGDWQFSRFLNFGDAKYIGIDVVPKIIDENKKRYSNERVEFRKLDASEDSIPSADLVLCKDVLQHLDDERAKRIIGKASNTPLFLLTNDYNPINLPGELGGARPLNPIAEPFCLKATPVLFFAGKVSFLAEQS